MGELAVMYPIAPVTWNGVIRMNRYSDVVVSIDWVLKALGMLSTINIERFFWFPSVYTSSLTSPFPTGSSKVFKYSLKLYKQWRKYLRLHRNNIYKSSCTFMRNSAICTCPKCLRLFVWESSDCTRKRIYTIFEWIEKCADLPYTIR